MTASSTSSAPTEADRHDLIRVQGARVNNLKDVSVEIPKRRLTVFTGVSGSGKSSLVFGTIAAESQRLINETYSAFVQGFMPTLARPDVDLLDGLTTAIIVDQERMGANVRSTVGTATDANALLRLLFSRLGKPHIGPPTAYSFNIPQRKASGAMTVDRGRGERIVVRDAIYHGGMCPRCEGMGSINDMDLTQLYDATKSLERGRAQDPGLQHGRLVRPHLRAAPASTWTSRSATTPQKELDRPAPRGADQDQGRGRQPHLRGADPEDPEVDAVEGHRHAAAARPGVRRAGGDVLRLPRLRRHPAQRAGPVLEDRRHQHRRRLRHADRRSRRVAARPGRAVGRAPARRPPAHVRLVRRDRARLSLARPAVGHAVGRRIAAHQDDPPPRLVADRRHLRLRRADDRAASARHRPDERPAATAARQGQHGARRRAQARGHRAPPTTSSTSARAPATGAARWSSRARVEGLRTSAHADRAAPGRPRGRQAIRADRHRAGSRCAAPARTTSRTSMSTSRSACWWC